MAKNSQARINANSRYNKKAYDTISIRVQKYIGLPAIIEAASQKAGTSKAGYIFNALVHQLTLDGFSVSGSDTAKGGCAEGGNAEGLTGGSMQGIE